MERLEEIRERLDNATPGSWEWQDDILCGDEPDDLVLKPFYDDDTGEISTCIFPNDKDFIAHSPDDIKYLLEQLTALQNENERLKNQYKISRDTDNGALEEYDTLVKELREENAELKAENGEISDSIIALTQCNAELKTTLEEEREYHNVYVQLMSDKCATLTKALELAVPSGNDRKCYMQQAEVDHDK